MGVRVNTNVDAFEAQRNIGLVSMDFSKAVQQLSSGLRINSAADDAAGLSISQKLQTQVNGFDQGGRNAQDAISMIQTGESALNTTHSILQRMRQLAVQAANDTNTTQDRQNIQDEINQLISEIDRIAQQTDFNTKKLLDGSAGGAQAAGGGPNVKGIVVQAGVALATAYSITAGTVNNAGAATRSAVEASAAQGSFFTQTSSITIVGGLGTQTFTAQAGESLETFFQVVNNSGIGVTMRVDSSTAGGKIQIVNNNFGINTGTGQVVNPAGLASVVDIGTGFTFQPGTVFTGGPTAVTVIGATGDFSTTGLCMGFGSPGATLTGSVLSDGYGVNGVSSNGVFTTFAASNAVVIVNTLAGSSRLTATGINSDTLIGYGLTQGLVITLQNPGALTSSSTIGGTDTINVTENASLQFHVGANTGQTIGLRIDAANSQALGVSSLSLLTQQDAETAIAQLDRAIQSISSNRSRMGAIMNRLTNSLTNDQTAQENALAANSRIRDVNVAQETVQFTRDQILLQAGTSILAQANQSPAGMLALLR